MREELVRAKCKGANGELGDREMGDRERGDRERGYRERSLLPS